MPQAANPILETADVFYNTPEVKDSEASKEVEGQAETDDVASVEDQTTEKTDHPDEPEEKSEGETEEEVSEDEQDDTNDEDKESVYLELDGKEIDLEDVRTWRDGHLMRADYIRKTQEIAEDRKGLNVQLEEVNTLKQGLTDYQAELKALIDEDEAIDWKELREIDPDQYIALKEKVDKRKAAVEKYKATKTQIPTDVLKTEQKLLYEANPTWLDDKGQPTEAMKADAKLLNDHWQKNGYTANEVNGMYRARFIEDCLKAAKFDELQEKSKTFVKKAKKATLVTKPKSQARQVKKEKSLEELFYKS